ncbi:MAG: DNA-directed RNA polymerase subunit omega [Myxococcota bacterium]
MARITIEDCMEQVPNRFELVRMASIRAKQLKKGARPLLEQTNKEVVTSLREIAAGLVQPGDAEVPPAPEYDAAAFDAAPPVEEAAEAAPETESAGAPVDEEPQP